jgi:hypothetical protein
VAWRPPWQPDKDGDGPGVTYALVEHASCGRWQRQLVAVAAGANTGGGAWSCSLSKMEAIGIDDDKWLSRAGRWLAQRTNRGQCYARG